MRLADAERVTHFDIFDFGDEARALARFEALGVEAGS